MSVTQKLRRTLWKRDATWRDVVIIAAAIVLIIALIGAAR